MTWDVVTFVLLCAFVWLSILWAIFKMIEQRERNR